MQYRAVVIFGQTEQIGVLDQFKLFSGFIRDRFRLFSSALFFQFARLHILGPRNGYIQSVEGAYPAFRLRLVLQ